MDKLKTIWDVTVETLSPLHIGNGNRLLLGYDLVTHPDHRPDRPELNRTFRIHEDHLFETRLQAAESAGDKAALDRLMQGLPADQLLERSDFQPPYRCFRYIMPGAPSASSKGAGVQEQIKNAYDRPYLPGSTLKGALRSILFWASYTDRHKKPDLDALRFSRSWAAQDLERDFFGRDPNHDWLRALHVEDSAPLEPPKLRLQQVRVYSARTPGAPGAPVDVEAAPMRVAFSSRIRLDEYFLHADIARKLGWPSPRDWFTRLAEWGCARANQRIAREQRFFAGRLPVLAKFYEGLAAQLGALAENEFFAQIGWGAGWESKTLGSELLATDKVAFENVLDRFRMTRGRRQAGDAFPVSRVVALDDTAQPYAPLGWVKVRLEGYEPTKGGAP